VNALTARAAQQRAADLVPVFRQRAAQTEQLRQLPPETVRDLLDSGLIRIGNPQRFGGAGLDMDAAFAVSAELGRGCGSTAWCYAVWTAHNWWIGHFPEQGQEEYFAAGPDVLMSTALAPAGGTALRVPGGFEVSGRWAFSTGCDAADWAMVGCEIGKGERRWLLLPRADYAIDDTWFASGLRGSGSKDVVVQTAFVPDHRTLDPDRAGDDDRTGWELHQRVSYAVPLKVLHGWALSAPVLGMAQAVVDEFTARARHHGGRLSNAGGLLRLSEGSAAVAAARALHRTTVQEILTSAAQGGPFSAHDRARYLRDASFTVQLCLRAADRLYEASGARAILDSDPIQRQHRDVQAAAHHAALNWDAAAEQFGRLALGAVG
jgi:3-hydroxy-9,10-secoandrosta-1,3,5(10)-triene-9,17-dione monooxygenase